MKLTPFPFRHCTCRECTEMVPVVRGRLVTELLGDPDAQSRPLKKHTATIEAIVAGYLSKDYWPGYADD